MIGAALAAAAAAWAWFWATPPDARLRAPAVGSGQRPGSLVAAFVAVAACYAAAGAQGAGWMACLVVAVATGAWLWRQHRGRAVRERREEAAARAATTLAMLLRSGQLPLAALDRAAATHELLVPVASAARVGADVTEALLAQGEVEGQEALRPLGAAWRVGETTGAPIADSVAMVAAGVRSRREVQRQVSAELASARASARVMALLPLAALGLGTVVGANPLGVLAGGVGGQLLVSAAVVLTAGGAIWNERIVADAGERP